MITFLLSVRNHFSQKLYDKAIAELPLYRVRCTCGKCGTLIFYGTYKRSVKYLSVCFLLTVQRVRCRECRVSHALLPDVLVPYSQIPLHDQQQIIRLVEDGMSPAPVLEQNCLIDENNVKHIIRQYRKHWKERIRAIGRKLSEALTIPCMASYSRQFMQIHRTRNQLYISTNRS